MAISVPSPQRRAFANLVRRADSQVDLAHAALLIAQEEYPSLDIPHYLARLDDLAAAVRVHLAAMGAADEAPPPAIIAALNQVVFAESGFHGNREDYYDPRNSFLNEVLDRRIGIPITISLVYMEVAARVGLPLHGIGMPGHFIVAYTGPGPASGRPRSGEVFIDPYNAGALLTRAACAAHFRRLYGPDFTFSSEYLTPLTRHQILARMLRNLKAIYLRRRDYGRAATVVDRLLLVQPAAFWELKDRGLLHYRLGAFRAAGDDLRAYLERDPDAEDAPTIQYYVNLCRQLLSMLN